MGKPLNLSTGTPVHPNECIPKEWAEAKFAGHDDIPAPAEPLIQYVSEMFDFPSDAGFTAMLYKSTKEGKPDMIRIFALDTTGIEADLVVTAALGFGSRYTPAPFAGCSVVTDPDTGEESYVNYNIKVTQENGNMPTQIRIPKECNSVNIFYPVGNENPGQRVSWWRDTRGIVHPFNRDNTPLSGFMPRAGDGNYMIAGVLVDGLDLQGAHITFGDDYLVETEIPSVFLAGLRNLVIDLSGLRNVEVIGEAAFTALEGRNKKVILDLSPLTKVKEIRNYAFAETCDIEIILPQFENDVTFGAYAGGLSYWRPDIIPVYTLDLSGLDKATSFGDYAFCLSMGGDEPCIIQLGGVDWSAKTVGVGAFDIPSRKGTFYADSTEVVNNFLQAIGVAGKLHLMNGWPKVINNSASPFNPINPQTPLNPFEPIALG